MAAARSVSAGIVVVVEQQALGFTVWAACLHHSSKTLGRQAVADNIPIGADRLPVQETYVVAIHGRIIKEEARHHLLCNTLRSLALLSQVGPHLGRPTQLSERPILLTHSV